MMFFYWLIFDIDACGSHVICGVFACKSGALFRHLGYFKKLLELRLG